MKTIKQIFEWFNLQSNDTRQVKNICDDTRLLKKNDLFIALDIEAKYQEEAYRKGSLNVLCSKDIPNLKERYMDFLLWLFDIDLSSLIIVGITGTNGKSNTAFVLHNNLKNSYLITNVSQIKDSYQIKNTTPYPLDFIKACLSAIKRKKKILILEVSSIAMSEKRLNDIIFDYFVLLNLEVDHLDYHHTIEEYHNTKINYVQKYGRDIIVSPDLMKKMDCTNNHIEGFENPFIINDDQEKMVVKYQNGIQLSFNIYEQNTISSYSVLLKLKEISNEFSFKNIKIENLKGRSHILKRKPLVVVDYAHTIASFKNLLLMYQNRAGRLIVVFGSGGSRDKTKRRAFGDLAIKYSDIRIVTEDNSRNEDVNSIINEIIDVNKDKFRVIPQREKAIHYALSLAYPSDIVLIIGKGHEEYIDKNNKRIPFSDIKEVKKWHHK